MPKPAEPTTKLKRVTVIFTPERYNAILASAQADRRAVSTQVDVLVGEALAARKQA